MSAKSEESDQKFRDWKEELLRRCEEHLKNHPEEKPRVPTSKGFVLPNTLVLVNQDTTIKDCWQVYVNGDLVFMNQGPFAQRDALRFAIKAANHASEGFIGNDVANKRQSIIPPMCIFCGNRYSHRTDCPDQHKSGPDLTGQAGV